MTECHEKYAATITTEPEELLQSNKQKFTAPDSLMACLEAKVPKEKGGKCQKNKNWSPQRAKATRGCAKKALQSFVQEDPRSVASSANEDFDPMADPHHIKHGCPDTLDYCEQRKPVEVFETGMTLMECTEICLKESCGCPMGGEE